VRESALRAVLSYLQWNQGDEEGGKTNGLITLDVARRVVMVVSNALAFANQFVTTSQAPSGLYADEVDMMGAPLPAFASSKSGGLTLRASEALLRKRVFECFSELVGFSTISDSTQAALLQACVSAFGSPEAGGSAVQAAISSATGASGSVWTSGDSWSFGVTFDGLGLEDEKPKEEDPVEVSFDQIVSGFTLQHLAY
jgi:hypothetical protein